MTSGVVENPAQIMKNIHITDYSYKQNHVIFISCLTIAYVALELKQIATQIFASLYMYSNTKRVFECTVNDFLH